MSQAAQPLEIRPLSEDDREPFIALLSHLTDAPPLDDVAFTEIFSQRNGNGMITLVAVPMPPSNTTPCPADDNENEVSCSPKIAGTVSLFFERKFTRSGGLVSHMEDVVTHPGFRGQGVATALIKAACDVARERGSYKMILDCSEPNAAFYEKVGFHRKEIQMRMDL